MISLRAYFTLRVGRKMSSPVFSSLQAIRRAALRSPVPLVGSRPTVLMIRGDGGARFISKAHPWASHCAAKLNRSASCDGGYMAVVRHVFGQRRARGWSSDETHTALCAAGVDLDFAAYVDFDARRSVHRCVYGSELVSAEASLSDLGASGAQSVLIDMCPAAGFTPNALQVAAADGSADAAVESIQLTLNALRLVEGILHRDSAVLCRVPSRSDHVGNIFVGLRDAFRECRFVAASPEDDTKLLLACRSGATADLVGGTLRHWEKYHRKMIPKREARRVPFGSLSRRTKSSTPQRYFVMPLASRNLELASPARVEQRQLETLRRAMQRRDDDDAVNRVAACMSSEDGSDSKS